MQALDYLKVLLVEDNEHMRSLLRDLLGTLGIKDAFEAADGNEAFRLLRDKRPDLILTDLAMKPVDGIAFTRRVRTSPDSPNVYVPILMLTGHTERLRVESARDAGVTEFLAKPVTPQGLFLRLSEIIERPRAFVRSETYFGPDRRRRRDDPNYCGPFRRESDRVGDVVLVETEQ
jgi:CheY-like chemotaxis protein